MTLLPEQIPEYDRKLVGLIVETKTLGAGDERLLGLADRGDPERSPLMSAAKPKLPRATSPPPEPAMSPSCPCPVAPVTNPWRLASARVRTSGLELLPTKIVPSLSSSAIAITLADNSGYFHRAASTRSTAAGRDIHELVHDTHAAPFLWKSRKHAPAHCDYAVLAAIRRSNGSTKASMDRVRSRSLSHCIGLSRRELASPRLHERILRERVSSERMMEAPYP